MTEYASLIREDAEFLFEGYFEGKSKILQYFGAEVSRHLDYDLDRIDDAWAVVAGDRLVWGEVPDDWCEDGTQEEWNYSEWIRGGFFSGKDFSLALVDLQMGGSGAAMILDNAKRVYPPQEEE